MKNLFRWNTCARKFVTLLKALRHMVPSAYCTTAARPTVAACQLHRSSNTWEGAGGADVSAANMIYGSRCFPVYESTGCVSRTMLLPAALSTPTFVCVPISMTTALVFVCVCAHANTKKRNSGFDHSHLVSVSFLRVSMATQPDAGENRVHPNKHVTVGEPQARLCHAQLKIKKQKSFFFLGREKSLRYIQDKD